MSISFAIIGAAITLVDANVAQTIKSGLDAISPSLSGGLGLTEGLVAELGKNSAAWTGTFFAMFGGASVVVPHAVGKVLKLSDAHPQQAPEIKIEQGAGISMKLGHCAEKEAAMETAFPLSEETPQTEQGFAEKVVAGRNSSEAEIASR